MVRYTPVTLIKFNAQGNQTPSQTNYIYSFYCKQKFQIFYYKHSRLIYPGHTVMYTSCILTHTLKWNLLDIITYMLHIVQVDV